MHQTDYQAVPVAVLGCGWLGLPLARALTQAGHAVAGSTTSPDKLPLLAAAGIRGHVLRLGAETRAAEVRPVLAGAQVLVLNVPPGQRRDAAPDPAAYPALLQPVADALADSSVRQVIFISSTGVYADEPRRMTEADALAAPDAASGLLRAEWLLQQPGRPWLATVLRLGGLMGPGRAPGRFLAGRTELPQPAAPVNMLHLADALGVVQAIVHQQAWGPTFNVCAPAHPSRQSFYTAAADFLRLPAPRFLSGDQRGGKYIDTTALHEQLRYEFRHPDPQAALDACA
ncbi:NAD(P)H-binding protein [Hymenobacter sp. B81]|uniref:NAD(P)H-binding protein n=1 Tax=Hymenobacter sp. B81 TaxID=3344878 RepID=UPI0037DCF80E